MGGPPQGGKLSGAMASVLADTLHKYKQASHGHDQAAKHQFVTDLMERFEGELTPGMGQLVGWLAEREDLPDELRHVVDTVTGPNNQVDFLYQFASLMGFILSAAFQVGAPKVQGLMNEIWAASPSMPLSPAEAALAVLRGNVDMGYAAKEASHSGYSAERFKVMVDNTGEPPGIQELLEAHRRGIIDQATLGRGILQSRYRNEWLEVIERLAHGPMPTGEAVAAVVQNQMSMDDGRRIAQENGLEEGAFDVMVNTHGNPPGIQEMGELWHRGDLTLAQFEQGIRESHYKNKYVPAIVAGTRRLPPERTVVSMVSKGVYSPAQGLDRLLKLGFDHEDAAALVSEATATKHQRTRDLALSEITTLYMEQAIARDHAVTMLESLGFDAGEADFVLLIEDNRRHRRYQEALITRAHSLYVSRHIERDQASSLLDHDEVPSAQRDELLTLWDLERAANTTRLTLSQLEHAYKAQLITADQFKTRVSHLGYKAEDVDLLEQLTRP